MIDIHDSASVRNLERIQEDGPRDGGGRGATLALVVVSGACILFATMAFGARRTSTPAQKKVDPLAELPEHPVAAVEQHVRVAVLDQVAAAGAAGVLPGRRLPEHRDSQEMRSLIAESPASRL